MKVIVLGSAPCLFEDMENAYQLCDFDKIYAVNQAPLYMPDVDVWVSAHAEMMPQWQALYKVYHRKHDLSKIEIVCSNRFTRAFPCQIDRTEPIYWENMQAASAGSSAMLAVKTAINDGATHVVVCGCPLDDSGNLGTNGGDNGKYFKFRAGWDWAKKHAFNDRVRGMSGYPEKLLRKPSKYWLDK